MVADIATITSFVVLVAMKLSTIPLLFDWLTRLKCITVFRDFFMPTVATLGMDFRMTGLTQRNKITLLVCSSLGQRQLVMHLLHRTKQTFPIAFLTEWVLGYIAVTDSFPCPSVPTAYSRVSVVLLVALVLLPLVFLTEPPLCQVGTAGKGTGALWFSWHSATSLCTKKAPAGLLPRRLPVLMQFSMLPSYHALTETSSHKVDIKFPKQKHGQFFDCPVLPPVG